MPGLSGKPAAAGGTPAFEKKIPITKPTLPSFDELREPLQAIYESGMVTNATNVRSFEENTARYMQVPHALAVSSCTLGLILSLRHHAPKGGEVILPSFTFSASGHALRWAGLKPHFVDILPDTLNVDPAKVEAAISDKTSAIMGVHVFGNPAAPDQLEKIAARHDLPLIFDAAHAFGSAYKGKPVGGFGSAEVFSLSPTKLVVAGEGGIVSTRDEALARYVRIGREYGNPGDYDCEFAGVNARMSEPNGLLANTTLKRLDDNVARRTQLVEAYKKSLADVPGISFQRIIDGGHTTFKDFAVLVDAQAFGMDRDALHAALDAENIDTRNYFDPPLHSQKAYVGSDAIVDELPVTEDVVRRVISLPLYSHMEMDAVHRVCGAIRRIQSHQKVVA